MLDDCSNINELFKFFKDDPEMKELGKVFNDGTFILSKLIEEFEPFAFENTEGDIPDYRHYLFIFLARTSRIFQSISLLILHERFCEAIMLERPFIENIVNTKIFLQRKSRAKALRKIRLYENINDALYCEFLNQDLDEEIEREGFTFSSNVKVLNDMREEVENGLKTYEDREKEKMRISILDGRGWHGEKMKHALAISKMGQHSQTNDLSCMLLHVREPNPFFCVEKNDVVEKSFMLNGILMTLFEHLNDFGTTCKNTFTLLNLFRKIEDNKAKLHKLALNKMIKFWEVDHNRKKIIIKKEK
jgi:hypothetical protein